MTVQSLRVKVDDRYVASVTELLATTFPPDQLAEADEALNITKNIVRTRFIPGGQQQMVFRVPRTPENEQYWKVLQESQRRWTIEYCYCSVFEECWKVLGKWSEPEQVDDCVRDEPKEFTP